LEGGGIEIAPTHKHRRHEIPGLWWVHVYALGDPVKTARVLRGALDIPGLPLRGEDSGRHTRVAGHDLAGLSADTLNHRLGRWDKLV
jgi:hypothetical protein